MSRAENWAALNDTARELGVNPLDLAAITGFESGNRANLWGGQGGKYYGAIQFSPEARRAYGVRIGMSYAEQIRGPVKRYLKDRFAKVGMSTRGASLQQLYTAVLAGNPRANIHRRDSFGTSVASAMSRLARERSRAALMYGAQPPTMVADADVPKVVPSPKHREAHDNREARSDDPFLPRETKKDRRRLMSNRYASLGDEIYQQGYESEPAKVRAAKHPKHKSKTPRSYTADRDWMVRAVAERKAKTYRHEAVKMVQGSRDERYININPVQRVPPQRHLAQRW